jgi:hypothetical protein
MSKINEKGRRSGRKYGSLLLLLILLLTFSVPVKTVSAALLNWQEEMNRILNRTQEIMKMLARASANTASDEPAVPDAGVTTPDSFRPALPFRPADPKQEAASEEASGPATPDSTVAPPDSSGSSFALPFRPADPKEEALPEVSEPDPAETLPETAAPEPVETLPETAVPEPAETLPETAVPEPVETLPGAAVPEEPVETLPGAAIPEETLPAPVETLPEAAPLPAFSLQDYTAKEPVLWDLNTDQAKDENFLLEQVRSLDIDVFELSGSNGQTALQFLNSTDFIIMQACIELVDPVTGIVRVVDLESPVLPGVRSPLLDTGLSVTVVESMEMEYIFVSLLDYNLRPVGISYSFIDDSLITSYAIDETIRVPTEEERQMFTSMKPSILGRSEDGTKYTFSCRNMLDFAIAYYEYHYVDDEGLRLVFLIDVTILPGEESSGHIGGYESEVSRVLPPPEEPFGKPLMFYVLPDDVELPALYYYEDLDLLRIW